MLQTAASLHGIDELRGRNRFWQAGSGPVGVCQSFDVFFVIASNDEYRKILAARADCTEQGQSVRPGFKVDHNQVEISADAADNLQRIAGTVGEVTDATGLGKRLGNRILQRRVVRQQKYKNCLHAARLH